MNLLEEIRFKAFWFVDFLKGGKIKNHFEDVKYILENFDDKKSMNKRGSYIENLLKHTINTVPYYVNYKDYKSLSDFPVVDKLLLRNEIDSFISTRYKNKSGFEVSTSGSTGTPFIIIQDKNKKLRNTADTLYFNEKSGYKVGYKLYYIRAWGNLLKKNPLISFLQNTKTINIKSLSKERMPLIIKNIAKGNGNKAFVGYASFFDELCKYLESINSKPIHSNISSMITISEPLSEKTKKAVKKYFGFDILSRYSNMENGILSQQFHNAGDNFHINWASYYIELLDLEKDVPVTYGKPGRVVVTDLFNFYMPMIRYDTGDIAVMDIDEKHFNGAPSFFKVEGRRMDTIYDTKGKIMTTVVYELEHFPEFKQFQLIQESQKGYLVKINIDGIFQEETKMIGILKHHLGADATVRVEYVDEVPQLSSGKRKLTLNTYLS